MKNWAGNCMASWRKNLRGLLAVTWNCLSKKYCRAITRPRFSCLWYSGLISCFCSLCFRTWTSIVGYRWWLACLSSRIFSSLWRLSANRVTWRALLRCRFLSWWRSLTRISCAPPVRFSVGLTRATATFVTSVCVALTTTASGSITVWGPGTMASFSPIFACLQSTWLWLLSCASQT